MAVTLELIKRALSELGLGRGEVVLVHSDLRMLGPARELVKLPHCGADLIIDAFLETLGREGLAVVPTFTKTWDTGREPYTGLVFDPAETPSRVGSVTNVFWRRPAALRSNHPTHSVAAIGQRADEFCRAPSDQSTFDRRGPWGKMHDWDGHVCFFGTDNRTNTTVHVVEDWMDLPYMETGAAWVKGADGRPTKVKTIKSPLGPRDFYRRNSKCARLLEASGIIRTTRIGGEATSGSASPLGGLYATISLMRVRELHRVLREGIIADSCLLLKEDSPGDEWTRRARAEVVRHVRRRFGELASPGEAPSRRDGDLGR